MPKKKQLIKSAKSSIVRTREIIANKFRKLHRDQQTKDRRLREKYAPLTDSINKLIDAKENLSAENEQLNHDMNEFKPNEKDLMIFDDVEMESFPDFALKNEVESKKRSQVSSDISSDLYGGKRINLETNNRKVKSTRKKRTKERKHPYSSDNGFSEPLPENNIELNKEAKTRFYERHNIRAESEKFSQENGLSSRRKKNNSTRKLHRANINDERRAPSDNSNKIEIEWDKNKDKQKFYEKHNVMPETEKFSDKERRISNRIQKDSTRKLHRANKNDAQRVDTDELTTSLFKEKHKKIVISPEDFDEEGYFQGLAAKRRKILVDAKKLKIVPLMEKRRRQKRLKRREVYKGGGLQKKFIPYAENIVYEYYDNPNELCERLRLLISSKSAGNTNHDQEINSIIEELRELHVIV